MCSASSSRENSPWCGNNAGPRFYARATSPTGFSLPRLGLPSRAAIRNDPKIVLRQAQRAARGSAAQATKFRRARRCPDGVGCPASAQAAMKQRTQAGLPTSRFMVIDTQRESIHLFRPRNPFGAMPGLQQPPEKQKLTSHSAPGNIAFAIHAHRRPSCRFMPQELLPALSLEKGKKGTRPQNTRRSARFITHSRLLSQALSTLASSCVKSSQAFQRLFS